MFRKSLTDLIPDDHVTLLKMCPVLIWNFNGVFLFCGLSVSGELSFFGNLYASVRFPSLDHTPKDRAPPHHFIHFVRVNALFCMRDVQVSNDVFALRNSSENFLRKDKAFICLLLNFCSLCYSIYIYTYFLYYR